MHTLPLDLSERSFSDFYEPRNGPRFSRKALLVTGAILLCYGVVGVYLMGQRYDITPLAQPPEPPTIVVKPWRETPPITTPTKDKPVIARQADRPRDTTVPPLPIPPSTDTASESPPTTAAAPPTTGDTARSDLGTATGLQGGQAAGLIRDPVWISRPTAEQMGERYPVRAAERGMTGTATLMCGIRPNGTMTACEVVGETPVGWRFGDAALSLARYFRISPRTVDGQAVEGFKVRIPIVFSMEN